MKSYFAACLYFFIFMNNISYGQSYECDNNFEECGTPNQSGGNGGEGSILIANTDLGDSYQHADDFDDDGIEDPTDNCPRYPNPDQLDRDSDSIGDMCDNCLNVWNPEQSNIDGDEYGDYCDDDIDNDQILNSADECPLHWGNLSCFNSYEPESKPTNNHQHNYITNTNMPVLRNTNQVITNSCVTSSHKASLFYFVIIFFTILVYKRVKKI